MRSTLLVIALTLFAATAALSQDNPNPTAKISAPQATSKAIDPTEDRFTPSTVDNSRRLAMHDELRSAREQVRNEVLNLSAQITQNTSPEERMELQRQVMRLKSDATLKSMNIQLKYAQLGGFTEQAVQLEENIELFQTRRDTPRSPTTTSTRPNTARGGEVR